MAVHIQPVSMAIAWQTSRSTRHRTASVGPDVLSVTGRARLLLKHAGDAPARYWGHIAGLSHGHGSFRVRYQPTAQPSLRGSLPPIRTPVSGFRRMICPPPKVRLSKPSTG